MPPIATLRHRSPCTASDPIQIHRRKIPLRALSAAIDYGLRNDELEDHLEGRTSNVRSRLYDWRATAKRVMEYAEANEPLLPAKRFPKRKVEDLDDLYNPYRDMGHDEEPSSERSGKLRKFSFPRKLATRARDSPEETQKLLKHRASTESLLVDLDNATEKFYRERDMKLATEAKDLAWTASKAAAESARTRHPPNPSPQGVKLTRKSTAPSSLAVRFVMGPGESTASQMISTRWLWGLEPRPNGNPFTPPVDMGDWEIKKLPKFDWAGSGKVDDLTWLPIRHMSAKETAMSLDKSALPTFAFTLQDGALKEQPSEAVKAAIKAADKAAKELTQHEGPSRSVLGRRQFTLSS